MSYTYQVRYLHKTLAPQVSIDSFVGALNPKAIGVADKAQFYAPLRFSVQISGGINSSAGAIRLDVPVHANPNWLDVMKQRFADIIGAPMLGAEALAEMDFKTVTGRSISTVPVDKLHTVGKLNFFVKNKMIRLPSVPEIPIEYSLTKVKNIQSWIKDSTAELPELIARALLGKSVPEINAAIRMEGPIHRLIEDHLRGDDQHNWNEFVRVHHMNAPVSMKEEEAERALGMISRQILIGLRDFVAAAKEPISVYLQSMDAKRLERELKERGEDAEHYAPVLGAPAGGAAKSQTTRTKGLELFKKMAEDVISTPVLQRSIVDTLYNRSLPIEACRWYHYDPKDGYKAFKRSDADDTTPPPGQSRSVPKAGAVDRAAEKARAAQRKAEQEAAEAAAAEKAAAEALALANQRGATTQQKRAAEDARKKAQKEKDEADAAAAAAKAAEEEAERQRKAVGAVSGPYDAEVAAITSKTGAKTFLNNHAGDATAKNVAAIYKKWGAEGLEAKKDTLVALVGRLAPGAVVGGKKTVDDYVDTLVAAINDGTIKSNISDHHPWNAQIHHTLLPVAGVYPAYYNAMHTKNNMASDAPFVGNAQATYAAYHMFVGAPASPAGVVVDPIACHAKGHSRRRSSSSSSDEDERVKGNIAPPVIPVGERAPYAITTKGDRPPMKRMVNSQKPDLVERIKARMVPWSEEEKIGDAAPIDEDFPNDDYGLPLSSDAFD